MSIHLGIDFGTTNSVVAQLVEEPARAAVRVLRSELGEERTPSAVAVTRDGRWLFGQPAREADARDKVLSVKRLLGSGEAVPLGGLSLQPEAVAALLFRHLVLTAQRALDEPVQSAVVTVPANSKGLQRSATKVAAAAAGLRVLNLINEPTAAAMAYGLGRAGQELRVLVYDFGGGTFDVTILRAHHGIFEELASRGLRRCGGDDLDAALAEQLRGEALAGVDSLDEPYPALRLRLACEAAKIELSRAEASRVDVEDLLPGVSLHETVTREALEALAFPIIERTAEPVREALAAARLLPSDLDHILLVGGSSRMPMVREFVENLLGQAAEPFDQADPMTCVAQGAAIVAGILGGAKHLADLDYQVCLEHSLCTEPVDPMTGRRYLEPVIEHGTKIPNRNSKVYFPVADYSAEVTVRIVEGNVYDDPASEENAPLGRVRVPLEPPRPSDDCPIEVQFEYSEDGLLTAVARDLRQERTFSQVIDYRSGHLSDAEQADLAALLAEVFGAPAPEATAPTVPRETAPAADEPAELREARRRLAQADQVLEQVPGDETNLLRELRDELDGALASGDATAVAEVDGRLAAELMFFDYLL